MKTKRILSGKSTEKRKETHTILQKLALPSISEELRSACENREMTMMSQDLKVLQDWCRGQLDNKTDNLQIWSKMNLNHDAANREGAGKLEIEEKESCKVAI